MSKFKIADSAQVTLFDKETGETIAFGEVSPINIPEEVRKQYKYKVEIKTSSGEVISYGTNKLEFTEDGRQLETDIAIIENIELD